MSKGGGREGRLYVMYLLTIVGYRHVLHNTYLFYPLYAADGLTRGDFVNRIIFILIIIADLNIYIVIPYTAYHL